MPTAADNILENYLNEYSGDNFSLLNSLQKTLQSKNITIEDWNALVGQTYDMTQFQAKFYEFINEFSNNIVHQVVTPDGKTQTHAVNLSLPNFNINITANTINGIPDEMKSMSNRISELFRVKLDKVTTTDTLKLYGIDLQGNQTMYPTDLAGHVTPFYMVRRESDSSVRVPEDPTYDLAATSKKYVDDTIAYEISKIDDEMFVIPDGVETITDRQYMSSPYKSIVIPNSVTTIEGFAFSHCYKLSNVKLSDNVTSIGEEAFIDCPINGVKIPKSVRQIGSKAFWCEKVYNFEVDLTDFGVDTPFPVLSAPIWYGNTDYVDMTGTTDEVTLYKTKIFVPKGRKAELEAMDFWTYDTPEVIELSTADTLENDKVPRLKGDNSSDYKFYAQAWGEERTMKGTALSETGTVMIRNSYGRAFVKDPDTTDPNPETVANVRYVKQKIAELIGGEDIDPALDTLKELAKALNDDENFATNVSKELGKKLDKTTTSNIAYGTDTAGGQTTYPVSSTADANSIILRDGNGRAKIATPDADADIANKAYADTKVAKVTTAHTATIAYTQDPDGGDTTCTLSSRGDRNTIMYRDVDGRSEIGYPAKDAHIANKQYVDTAAEYGYPPEDVLVIPNGTTDIADRAYGNTKYKRVIVPNSVTNIGKSAFIGCKNLKSITLKSVEYGSGLSSIKDATFYGCTNLESIVLPKTVHSIGREAFWQCYSLRSVTLPATLISIGAYAFFDCRSLERIVIPHGVSSISAEAFFGCDKLTEVIIPNSVTTIGDDAFGSCGINNIDLPNSLISIGNSVFDSTKLNSIVIPNSVTSIGSRVFKACTYLVDVTIGNSVTEIGFDIFTNCRNLKKIDLTTFGISKAFPMLSGTLFENYYGNDNPTEFQILVPKGRKAELEAMTNWSEYADKIVEVATTETLDSQKVDKLKNYASRGYSALYGQQVDGVETDYRLATEPAENSVMYRDSAGVSYVVTPVDAGATAVANKGYVDEAVKNTGGENKVDKLKDYATRGYTAAYIQLANGTETSIKVSQKPDGSSIIWRDSHGSARIRMPDDPVGLHIANKDYVDKKVASILNSAPETLDTLNELATALGNDPNFATTVSTEIGKKLDKYTGEHAQPVAYVQNSDGSEDVVELRPDNIKHSIVYRDFYGRANIESPTAVSNIANKGYVDNTVNKTHYGYSGDDLLIIPEGTTEIADNAYENTAYKCVVIPEGVTKIGYRAFKNARRLKTVFMPKTIIELDNSAFYLCINLTNIILPNGITRIGSSTFEQTHIVNMRIPNTVVSIATYAFWHTLHMLKLDLTSYGLSKTFPIVEADIAGESSPDLQILVPKGRKAELSAMTNWSAYADKIVEVATTETLDAQKVDKYTNPNAVEGAVDVYGVWSGRSQRTFAAVINNNTNTLVYRDNNGRSKISDPDADEDIANKHYVDTVITNATTGNVTADFVNKTHYGYSGDDLLIIPEGTTTVENYQYSTYKCVVIPEGVTTIALGAFSESELLTTVILPDSLKEIGVQAFTSCFSLNNVKIPNGVQTINDSVFQNCFKLTNITIPNSVTSIGAYAFYDCESLTSITIPDSVTRIGSEAFRGCTNFTKIDLTSYGTSKTFPTLGTDAFTSTNANLQILVPKGRKSQLAAMTNWSAYADNIVEVPTVETLESGKLDKLTVSTGNTYKFYYRYNNIDAAMTGTDGVAASSVVIRTTDGAINTAYPTENSNAANMQYVDDKTKPLTIVRGDAEFDEVVTMGTKGEMNVKAGSSVNIGEENVTGTVYLKGFDIGIKAGESCTITANTITCDAPLTMATKIRSNAPTSSAGAQGKVIVKYVMNGNMRNTAGLLVGYNSTGEGDIEFQQFVAIPSGTGKISTVEFSLNSETCNGVVLQNDTETFVQINNISTATSEMIGGFYYVPMMTI